MLQSPTGVSWTKASPIEVLVTRACDPSLPEPNYASHLEVAEYINSKKANNPREAAMTIARLANHRNPHVAILALALLDTLVQSCGYPFHLQISTKEFLNELVRRFPERPPPFPGPVMSRILELIHTWKEGICAESRWKEDLGNIRDMHRLLTFKGYRFRDIPRQQPAVAAAANLKSAEELEEEDRQAQSAKLQELIRRGTPRDLAAAQELMKSLAGANPEAKPDYRAQSLTELNKLEQKVILLNEMLDNVDTSRGEKFTTGDAYDQVSSILKAARPKIQKWISDAQNDDPESLDTFLQINDQINSVVNRYEAFKKGDYSIAATIPAEFAPSAQPISLIDFDDSEPSQPAANVNPANDLAGLFGGGASSSSSPPAPQQPSVVSPFTAAFGAASGAPSFGAFGAQPFAPQPQLAGYNNGPPGNLFGSSSPPQSTATPPAAIRLGSSNTGSPAPNYFSNPTYSKGPVANTGALGTLGHASPPPMFQHQPSFGTPQQQAPAAAPAPVQQQQQQQQQQQKDPFADLAGLF
ncbi:VHS domain-containing protein [Ephemerocybe angulata]|uniref:VHS domain-containing protein n=1 Tax=Ephemerocybe angulata TaxID=980116 RepID=A0A8H6M657_9AGAR|nr:VHS domain-containing protein [Tulosesus angulatus]